jgi:uncharacterized protein (TIGR03435 family)
MKRFVFGALAGSMFCAASFAADVSGKWSGYPGYLVLKQDGAALTGTLGQSASEQHPFENGKIDGNRLTFQLGSYQADLLLEEGEIHGTMSKGNDSIKVFLRRVDETAGPPAFDVATVKRAAPSVGHASSSMRLNPGRITGTNVNLQQLIVNAYELKEYQVTGPDWLNSETYDIAATFPANTSMDLLKPMLKQLLVERFKLEVHRETKELPVYALVLDKAGLQLKAAEPLSDRANMSAGPKGRKLTGNMSLDRLAVALASSMDRPVVNFTGIKGLFEVKLEWTPDDTRTVASKSEGPLVNDAVDGPSIYAALHQAGLKLEPRKAPVEILVVDRAEKVPVEN